MPVAQAGAQRALPRAIRILAMLAFAASLVVGYLATDPTPALAASKKVVVVVGPVGSKTADYKDDAKRYASYARSYGASVTEIYSPYATWTKVKKAAQGANILISQAVWEAVEKRFHAEPAGQLVLKGYADPISFFEVKGEADHPL